MMKPILPKLVRKIRRLCEIVEIPNGLTLKQTEEAFNLRDMKLCVRLKSSGICPGTIFDVGANIGQFALGSVNAFPEAAIYSYEPVPTAFRRLADLSKTRKTITPIQLAIGSESGTMKMHVTNHTQSSSFLPLHRHHMEAYPHVVETGEIEVGVTTLAFEVEKYRPVNPALLKIDVQGFEFEVLKGAGDSLSAFEWILLEACTRPMYEGERSFEEVSELLEVKGFRFVSPFDIHYSSSGVACQFDALFQSCE